MFEIRWEERASKELHKLDSKVSSRIYRKVEELKNGFQSKDIKKVKGEDRLRLRVGDYRVLFSLPQHGGRCPPQTRLNMQAKQRPILQEQYNKAQPQRLQL